jgi:hypothetical protein
MKLVPLGVLTGIFLAAAAGSAPAAMESQVINYGSAASPVYGDVKLAGAEFDPALGTLTGVSIKLDSYDVGQGVIFSVLGGGIAYSDASISSAGETVSVQGLSVPLSTCATSISVGPYSGTTAGFINLTVTSSAQHLTASEEVLSANLPSFIGAGSQAFQVLVTPGAATYSGSGQSSTIGFWGVVGSYGTVEIDYDYAANVVLVPETGQCSLIAGGLAGCTALMALGRRIRGYATHC